MVDRSIDAMLAEWRALERELERTSDEEVRAGIEARLEAIRAEYQAAQKSREGLVDERPPRPKPP
jgi:hypothetical protein